MLEPTITVRRAGRLDRDAQRDLLRAGYAEHRAAMPEAFYAGWMEDLMDVEAREREAETYLAEIDGRPAGCISFYGDGSEQRFGDAWQDARVRALAVHPEARGLGIGQRLVDRCIVRARVLAAPAISLHTADFMVAAKRLYERFGLRRVPRYDFDAATVLGLDSAVRLKVIAYSLALDPLPRGYATR
jgi:ribosomal protein S18 acetylase RimI-like enzyme